MRKRERRFRKYAFKDVTPRDRDHFLSVCTVCTFHRIFFLEKKKEKKREREEKGFVPLSSCFRVYFAELFIDTIFVTVSIKRSLLGITPVFGDSQNYVIPLACSPRSRDGIGLNSKIRSASFIGLSRNYFMFYIKYVIYSVCFIRERVPFCRTIRGIIIAD